MATIGRNKAVAQIGRFHFTGFVAWWLWLVVHVLSLVEFRSRIAVVFEWAWAYFTWQRRSRVILEIPRELAPSRRLSAEPAPMRVAEPSAHTKNHAA